MSLHNFRKIQSVSTDFTTLNKFTSVPSASLGRFSSIFRCGVEGQPVVELRSTLGKKCIKAHTVIPLYWYKTSPLLSFLLRQSYKSLGDQGLKGPCVLPGSQIDLLETMTINDLSFSESVACK